MVVVDKGEEQPLISLVFMVFRPYDRAEVLVSEKNGYQIVGDPDVLPSVPL
jgi:hypothetical protein